MNILMRLSLGIIPLLFCLGCSKESPTESTDNQQPFIKEKTYTNPQIGFIVTFPVDWTMQMDVPISDYTASLYAEKEVPMSDNPVIALLTQTMDAKPPMDIMLDNVAEQLPLMLENVTILDKKVIMLNGYECGELTYSFTEAGILYKQKQLYYFNKTFIIIIGYTAIPAIFEVYLNDFNTIQDSIILTE